MRHGTPGARWEGISIRFLGPEYFTEIKGPFADVKLLACGGVRPENIKDYFKSRRRMQFHSVPAYSEKTCSIKKITRRYPGLVKKIYTKYSLQHPLRVI